MVANDEMALVDIFNEERHVSSTSFPLTASTHVSGTPREIGRLVRVVARKLLEPSEPLPSSDIDLEQEPSFHLATLDGVDCFLACAPAFVPKGAFEVRDLHVMTLGLVGDTQRVSRERADEILRIIEHVPFTPTELASLRDQMPITVKVPQLYDGQPLAGFSAIFTIHHMTDFLMMIEAAISLGLRPANVTVIDKEYAYQYRNRVDAHLKDEIGVAVYQYRDLSSALRLHFRRARRAGLRTLILDDGGYVLPRLLEDEQSCVSISDEVAGLVEQTSSGIWRLDNCEGPIPVPVFSVAQSDLKATIESYGVADACIRNLISLLPNEKFEGRACLVVGYGNIGREIAEILKTRRMRVFVFDKDTVRLLAARERGFPVDRDLARLISEASPVLIVGCAGRGSLSTAEFDAIRSDCYLASCTSRDYEFDLTGLRKLSARVRDLGSLGTAYELQNGAAVLAVANGFPINFHGAESMPNRYSDIVLASMLVGACALANTPDSFEAGHNVDATNNVIANSPIIDQYFDLYAR